MKVRFEIDKADRWRKDMFPCFAIDIKEVAIWNFKADGSLNLWFKGISEPVNLVASDVGEDNFCFLVTILSVEFPDVNDLKFRTVSKSPAT